MNKSARLWNGYILVVLVVMLSVPIFADLNETLPFEINQTNATEPLEDLLLEQTVLLQDTSSNSSTNETLIDEPIIVPKAVSQEVQIEDQLETFTETAPEEQPSESSIEEVVFENSSELLLLQQEAEPAESLVTDAIAAQTTTMALSPGESCDEEHCVVRAASVVYVGGKVVTQIEIDADYPCFLQPDASVLCPAISAGKLSRLSSLHDMSKGIPFVDYREPKYKKTSTIDSTVSKAEDRSSSFTGFKTDYLDYTKSNNFNIDTTKNGKLVIGFASNVFVITDFSADYLQNVSVTGGFTHLQLLNTSPYNATAIYMNFDVSGNTANDFSDYGNFGTVTNGGTWTSLSKYGGAYFLDGSNDYISVANSPSVAFTASQSFTWAVWVNNSDLSANVLFQDPWWSPQRGYYLILEDQDIKFVCTNNWSEAYSYDAWPTNYNGAYHHLAFTYNGSAQQLKAYVDGVSKTVNITSVGFWGNCTSESQNTFEIGGSDYPLNGSLDEVMFIRSTLNSSDVASLYNATAQRFRSSGVQTSRWQNISTGNSVIVVDASVQEYQDASVTCRVGYWDVSRGYSVNDSSLVAYYHFDGNGSDSSGFGNHLTTLSNVDTNHIGTFNNSLSYSGSSGYAQSAASGSLTNVSDEWTISLWARKLNNSDYHNLVRNVGSYRQFWIYTYTNDDFCVSKSKNSSKYYDFCVSNMPIDSTWHQWAASYSRSREEVLIYKDGLLVYNNTNSTVDNTTWTKGLNSSSSLKLLSGMNGSLDEVMVYSRRLSPDEVRQLYVAGGVSYAYTNYSSLGNNFSVGNATHVLPQCKLTGGFYSPSIFNITVSANVSSNLSNSSNSSNNSFNYYSVMSDFSYGICTNCTANSSGVRLNTTLQGSYMSSVLDFVTPIVFYGVGWNYTSSNSNENVTLAVRSGSYLKPNLSDSNLVGFLPLNQTSFCTDALGLYNGSATSVTCGSVTGPFQLENATLFDSNADKIVLPRNLGFDNDSWTVMLFAKSTGNCIEGQDLFVKQWDYRIFIESTSSCAVSAITRNSSGTDRYIGDFCSLIDGQWHQIVYVHNESAQMSYAYCDGVFSGSVSQKKSYANTANFSIGGGGGSGLSFNGSLAYVALFNRSLDANEIMNWSSWTAQITNSTASDIISLPTNRFVQFNAILHSNSTSSSPVLVNIAFFNNSTDSSYSLSYDENGNLVQDDMFYYEYNTFNQMVRVRNGNSVGYVVAEYIYDENGQRLKKTEYYSNGTVKKKTYYPDESFVQEIDSTTTNTTYFYAGNILIAENKSDTMKFFHPNHLGSTDITTNSSGGLVETSKEEPYGDLISGGSGRYVFTGQERDKEINLDYFDARYYAYGHGLFIQPDSWIQDLFDPQGLNRYTYVRNNPLKYTDPTGHWAVYFGLGGAAGAGPAYGQASISPLVFSYSKQYGFEVGFFAAESGDGYDVGLGGEGSVFAGFSPNAQRISDLGGKSTSKGGGLSVLQYGAGYDYGRNSDGSVTTHTLSYSPGVMVDFYHQVDFETSTSVYWSSHSANTPASYAYTTYSSADMTPAAGSGGSNNNKYSRSATVGIERDRSGQVSGGSVGNIRLSAGFAKLYDKYFGKKSSGGTK